MLVRTENGRPFYVGQTGDVFNRCATHLQSIFLPATKKDRLLAQYLFDKVGVDLVVVSSVPDEVAARVESRLCYLLGRAGVRLLNFVDKKIDRVPGGPVARNHYLDVYSILNFGSRRPPHFKIRNYDEISSISSISYVIGHISDDIR